MKLSCEECEETVDTENIEFEVIEEDEKPEDGNWFLDAEFREEDNYLEIDGFELYCPEHV